MMVDMDPSQECRKAHAFNQRKTAPVSKHQHQQDHQQSNKEGESATRTTEFL